MRNIFLALSLFFASMLLVDSASAIPLLITPKQGTAFPTSVPKGGSVFAFYTVSNNTKMARPNNFVKYLPPNVEQVTTGTYYPSSCGRTFDLAGKGQAGDSCTLQLKITGPVSANDPSFENHLYVCFPGGITCAGSSTPLDIVQTSEKYLVSLAVTPTPTTIYVTSTQQLTATGTYSDTSTDNLSSVALWQSADTSKATVSSSGLATGVSVGSTTVSATYQFIQSNIVNVNVSNPLISIAVTPTAPKIKTGGTQQFTATGHYYDGSSQDITNSASWLSSNTSVATIASTGIATGVSVGSSNITATFNSITSNTAVLEIARFVYVTDPIQNRLYYCPVNSNNTVGTCSLAASTLLANYGIAINSNDTYAYVSEGDNGNNLSYCVINNDGSLSSCTITGSGFTGPQAIVINSAGTYLYVADGSNTIHYCVINNNGSLSSCAATGSGFNNPFSIAINPAGTIAYVSNYFAGVSYCTINVDGTFSNCASAFSGGSLNAGVAVHPNGSYVYRIYGSSIYVCSLNVDGSFASCSVTGSTSSVPYGMAFNPAGTIMYIATVNGSLTYCTVNGDGTLTSCATTGGGMTNAAGIAMSN